MIKIKVPATSANMGAGFDSLGVALDLYNYVSVEETDGGLVIDIVDKSSDFLPKDERNLIYKSMKILFDKAGYTPRGLHIVLENNVMVTRGLGSSSAGIVGGLLAANEFCGRKFSKEEILEMATEIEGHPDNVAPAIFGGLTVNVSDRGRIRYVKTDVPEDLRFVAFVPEFYLQTKKSRGVLPKNVSMRDAVYNTGRSALLVTSIMTGKYENIRTAVGDRLHQRYRKKLIPHIDALFEKAYNEGALGVYLSGAGPTVIAIVDKSNTMFEKSFDKFLTGRMGAWNIHTLCADNVGAEICK